MIGPTVRGMLVVVLLAAPALWGQDGGPPPTSDVAAAKPAVAYSDLVRPWIVDGALVVLALLALSFTVAFFRALKAGSELSIESRWGGFGGGLGGWTLSRPLVLLLAALAFGGLLCAAVAGK